jgi:G:T-mismatch repair DNA endonuclease (very short patch repair protein)
MRRDEIVRSQLLEQNIKCLVIWECTIKKAVHHTENRDDLFRLVVDFLKDSRSYMEL